jgi:hypothetical protein
MHPTAKRCVQWAVAVTIAGAVLMTYGPTMFAAVARVAGANAEAGLGVLGIALTLVSSTAFPMGAALVGAAIVIQALAGRPDRSRMDPSPDADEPGRSAEN